MELLLTEAEKLEGGGRAGAGVMLRRVPIGHRDIGEMGLAETESLKDLLSVMELISERVKPFTHELSPIFALLSTFPFSGWGSGGGGWGSQATVTPYVHHRAMRCWTRGTVLPAWSRGSW